MDDVIITKDQLEYDASKEVLAKMGPYQVRAISVSEECNRLISYFLLGKVKVCLFIFFFIKALTLKVSHLGMSLSTTSPNHQSEG